MVNKKYDHITMENAKQYFMDTDCYPTYRDADWTLADEYRKLKIDKKIENEWINEYYETKFISFKSINRKCFIIAHILRDFKDELKYDLMKKYFDIYINDIDNEKKSFLILKNLLNKKSVNEFDGIIYICYINNDYTLMNKSIDVLKRLIKELDGVQFLRLFLLLRPITRSPQA